MEEALIPEESKEQDLQGLVFEKEHNEEGYWIQLSDPKNKSGHIVYKVEGEDKNGKIYVEKRYSDFDHLRTALTNRWPGIYIPPLPEKKILGNKEEDFLMERMHFLQRFVTGIVRSPHLLYSLEARNFFHSVSGVDKSAFNNQNIVNIKAKFCESFNVDQDTIQEEVLKFEEQKIRSFATKAKAILPIISEIKDKCRVGITARNQTNNNTDYLLRQFWDFEKNILKEVINNDPQLYVINSDPTFSGKLTAISQEVRNPYQIIYLWVKAQFLEIGAFNEAVAKRDFLEAELKKVIKKKSDLMTKLNKLDASKASIAELAKSSKPGSNFDKLKQLMDEEESYEVALRVTCKHLSHFLNLHKQQKTKEYYQMVKEIGESEELTSNLTINLWTSIFNACGIAFDSLENF